MKITTPFYYKDFKCIAGACTDTCCAGWDVDVDEASYKYYKSVKGSFGKRLKSVMVKSEEGGCTFTLNNGRCPFLNDENLCDLYIALGEENLCDTCAEFPRFINEYGNTREIGIAPSCITAGEIIFNYKDKLVFETTENDEFPKTYNDIDPLTYIQLTSARKMAYSIVQNRAYTINDRCVLLLEFAKKIQKHLDNERDELIANVVNAFKDMDYQQSVLDNAKKKYSGFDDTAYRYIYKYFDKFKGMEVINPDWFKVLEVNNEFMQDCDKNGMSDFFNKMYNEFDTYYEDRQFEYEQLLVYYVYRYFLDAVYDYNLVLKIKNGIVGYLILKQADVAKWYINGKQCGERKLSKAEQIDMAHLYSRQFEHSYSNFEVYTENFCKMRKYAYSNLLKILC
jgi:lysine-N-methylase